MFHKLQIKESSNSMSINGSICTFLLAQVQCQVLVNHANNQWLIKLKVDLNSKANALLSKVEREK